MHQILSKMNETLCWLNNKILPYGSATVHISDVGLQRGFGIFDYMCEVNGRILFFDDYLDRFYQSAMGLKLEVPLDREMMKEKIAYLLDRNQLGHSGIKILLTGGYSEDLYSPGRPNLAILNIPLESKHPEPVSGVRLITFEYLRFLPEVKTLNYLPSVMLLPEMHRQGAIDVLFHQKGIISETSRANVFLVAGGKLITPARNILGGITRKQVIAIAAKHMEVVEREVTLNELANGEEVFLTGTSKPVVPVTGIDTMMISGGRPGPVTLKLREEFARLVSGLAER